MTLSILFYPKLNKYLIYIYIYSALHTIVPIETPCMWYEFITVTVKSFWVVLAYAPSKQMGLFSGFTMSNNFRLKTTCFMVHINFRTLILIIYYTGKLEMREGWAVLEAMQMRILTSPSPLIFIQYEPPKCVPPFCISLLPLYNIVNCFVAVWALLFSKMLGY